MTPPNISCVECGGEYRETEEGDIFECEGCGHRLRTESAEESAGPDPDEVRDLAETVRGMGLGILAHELEEGAKLAEQGEI